MIKYLDVDHFIFGGCIFPDDFIKWTNEYYNVVVFATVSMTACNQNENRRLYIHDYIIRSDV